MPLSLEGSWPYSQEHSLEPDPLCSLPALPITRLHMTCADKPGLLLSSLSETSLSGNSLAQSLHGQDSNSIPVNHTRPTEKLLNGLLLIITIAATKAMRHSQAPGTLRSIQK